MIKVAALDTIRESKKNTYSKWGRGAGELSATVRIENGCVVAQSGAGLKIDKSSKIFTIGSCFARNIEAALITEGMSVLSRNINIPFDCSGPRKIDTLNKYNPGSIYHELKWALDSNDFPIDALQNINGSYSDLNLKAKTPPQSKESALDFRASVTSYFQQIKECDTVILTLGMIECWRDELHDIILNQPPHPKAMMSEPDRFTFCILELEDILFYMRKSIELLNLAGVKNIIITTSPVGLERTFTQQDVIVANCYSKSLLRVSCEVLSKDFSNVLYYPSFESVMYSSTELAWKPDFLHASDYVVSRIINEFVIRYVNSDAESLSINSNGEKNSELSILKNQVGKYRALLEKNGLL